MGKQLLTVSSSNCLKIYHPHSQPQREMFIYRPTNRSIKSMLDFVHFLRYTVVDILHNVLEVGSTPVFKRLVVIRLTDLLV
jgi:hypothetical protein